MKPPKVNFETDLVLERVVDVSPELIWKAWTDPVQLKQWFTPRPWKTIECHVDLKRGGAFRTTMESPEGEKFNNVGCYLEIIENQKLIWTSALLPGFRPIAKPENGADLFFTAIIYLEAKGSSTKYTAIVMHANPKDRKTHEDMGFADGWGKALDQLVEVAKKKNA